MKYWVIVLLSVMLSCKKHSKTPVGEQTKPTQEIPQEKKVRVNPYDIIMTYVLKRISPEKYDIMCEIDRKEASFNRSFERILTGKNVDEQEKSELKKKVVLSSLDTIISNDLYQKITQSSHHEKDKKEVVRYTFSLPYMIGKDKVIIFLSTRWGNIGKTRGSDRVFMFKKQNKHWRIKGIDKATIMY